MIPRRFFILFDALVLAGSFLMAHAIAPTLQMSIAPGSALRPWVEVLSPPSTEALGRFRPLSEVGWVLLVMIATTFVCMSALDGYRMPLRQTRTRIIVMAWLSSAVGLAFVTLVVFALRSPDWSRLFVFSFMVLSGLGLCTYRLALKWYQRRRHASGFYTKNVVLVGRAAPLAWMAEHFRRRVPAIEYQLLGFLRLTPDQGQQANAETVAGTEPLRALGDVDAFGDILVHEPVHEIVAIQPPGDHGWLSKLIEDCDYFRLTLHIVPETLLGRRLQDLKILYHASPLQLPEVVLEPPALSSDSAFAKRLIDLVVSLVLLIVLLPLFVVIAVAIKLTTPQLPIFYRYRAVGYKGRHFVTYKFRTMVANAEQRKAELIGHNQMTGPAFKMKDDPRVTVLGRYLRKFSLDELPQLWSVVRGDMSLVGPRPAPPHEVQRYELWHKRKLSVRPGITCLWQVGGRNRISGFDEWVRLDFEYIDRWSLWLDFKILLRTAWVVIRGTGW